MKDVKNKPHLAYTPQKFRRSCSLSKRVSANGHFFFTLSLVIAKCIFMFYHKYDKILFVKKTDIQDMKFRKKILAKRDFVFYTKYDNKCS